MGHDPSPGCRPAGPAPLSREWGGWRAGKRPSNDIRLGRATSLRLAFYPLPVTVVVLDRPATKRAARLEIQARQFEMHSVAKSPGLEIAAPGEAFALEDGDELAQGSGCPERRRNRAIAVPARVEVDRRSPAVAAEGAGRIPAHVTRDPGPR